MDDSSKPIDIFETDVQFTTPMIVCCTVLIICIIAAIIVAIIFIIKQASSSNNDEININNTNPVTNQINNAVNSQNNSTEIGTGGFIGSKDDENRSYIIFLKNTSSCDEMDLNIAMKNGIRLNANMYPDIGIKSYANVNQYYNKNSIFIIKGFSNVQFISINNPNKVLANIQNDGTITCYKVSDYPQLDPNIPTTLNIKNAL